MVTTEELLAKVESMKSILVSHATGTLCDDEEYKALRKELLSYPRLKAKLPIFLQSCRNLNEFWSFIKPMFDHYHERRDYLREQFDPVLTMLESEANGPGDEAVSAMLTVVDSAHVQDAWKKALERRDSDPEGAITSARTLLEAVCKYILDEEGEQYDDKEDLPKLYKLTANRLNLAPDQHTEQIFKQILGGCQTVVEGLGAVRNRLSDSHGRSKAAVKPAPRHAQLAVNLAGTMATFLIATWEARRNK